MKGSPELGNISTPLAVRPGMQPDSGWSQNAVYEMAEAVFCSWHLKRTARVIDIGGGAGHFTKRMFQYVDHVTLLDCHPRSLDHVTYCVGDLNEPWDIGDDSVDAAVCLEVIEHLENPRHLFRELLRILVPGGVGFLSTPNQLSLASILCLFARGQFREFQDSCYPAHITALLPVDLQRIGAECQVSDLRIVYSNDGRIPFSGMKWQQVCPYLKGRWFSDNLGVSFKKPKCNDKSTHHRQWQ